mmetsp:Transcript_9666/g.15975  ORF Transcript_9666/g.15975 Transcript_9666/m.15975 type:complete len:84 (+) Transcript_9666:852-1103(+)
MVGCQYKSSSLVSRSNAINLSPILEERIYNVEIVIAAMCSAFFWSCGRKKKLGLAPFASQFSTPLTDPAKAALNNPTLASVAC